MGKIVKVIRLNEIKTERFIKGGCYYKVVKK